MESCHSGKVGTPCVAYSAMVHVPNMHSKGIGEEWSVLRPIFSIIVAKYWGCTRESDIYIVALRCVE